MTGRRRATILAALALAVPLPALALTGASGSGLSVSASLEGCGVGGGGVVCGINASWSGVEGAEYYTVSVTAPDGSVTDLGEVGGGGATVWVPYTGNGTYTVSVSAYGVDENGDEKVLDTDEAAPEARAKSGDGQAHVVEGAQTQTPAPAAEDPEQPAEEAPVEDPPAATTTTPELPPCPPEPEATPAPDPNTPQDEAGEAAAPEVAPEQVSPPTDCVPQG